MIRLAIIPTALVVILTANVALHAQNPAAQRGAEIFRTTCAVAYCHGSEGTAGRAPQLAGRGLNPRDAIGIIMNGKPGGAMPGFSRQLKSEDIQAVAEYVLSLSRPAAAAAASTKPSGTELAPAAETGRALFFDAVRMGGCGKCHELEGRGSPVGPNLRASVPEQLRRLRAVAQTRVVTAHPVDEDAFPAVVAEQTPERVRVYDLSPALPVLRTFRAERVRITPGSAWSHASTTQSYSDSDLESLASYLTWLVATQSVK
jgi:mono/diheme cytochrome c family protein